jgi:hypothetical protein
MTFIELLPHIVFNHFFFDLKSGFLLKCLQFSPVDLMAPHPEPLLCLPQAGEGGEEGGVCHYDQSQNTFRLPVMWIPGSKMVGKVPGMPGMEHLR